MRIVVDRSIVHAENLFSPYGDIEAVRNFTSTKVRKAHVLIVRSTTKLNGSLLDYAPELRFIGSVTAGTNHLDMEYLKQRNIRWAAAAGSNARAVADYVLSGLVIAGELSAIIQGNKSLGLVGAGHTARELGGRIREFARQMGFSSRIYCYDPFIKDEDIKNSALIPVNFSELLRQDCISIHCSLQEGRNSSRGMFNERALHQLRPNCLLINTARGEVIAKSALTNLLSSKKSIRLILDVWHKEPFVSPDIMTECLIATPHIAGYSRLGKERALLSVFHAFQEFRGERIAEIHDGILPDTYHYHAPFPQARESIFDYVGRLLLTNYDPRKDSLRALQELESISNEENRAHAFTLLRNNYVLRREACEWQSSHLPHQYRQAARAVLR